MESVNQLHDGYLREVSALTILHGNVRSSTSILLHGLVLGLIQHFNINGLNLTFKTTDSTWPELQHGELCHDKMSSNNKQKITF